MYIYNTYYLLLFDITYLVIGLESIKGVFNYSYPN